MKKARSLILQPIQRELQLIFKGSIQEKVLKQERQSPLVRIVILLLLFQEQNQTPHFKKVPYLLVELIMQHFIQLKIQLLNNQQI